jgi:pyrroline-5-carboxylate reductase
MYNMPHTQLQFIGPSMMLLHNNNIIPVIINFLTCIFNSYSMMIKCWALSPEDRPDFKNLSSSLGKLLEISADYLELSMVLLPSEAEDNQEIAKT